MVDDCLFCDILMTLVSGHSHDKSSMKKSDLLDNADGGLDRDKLETAVDEVVDQCAFLREWGAHRDSRIHLDQSTGKVVDVLVEDCDEHPAWLKPELSHVPRETWLNHDVTS